MAFTNFCCRSGGSNLNAGTRTGNTTEPGTSADFTYASGNWVQSTGVFTVASGNPATDGVAVGDFASVYADGSSQSGFVGRVTARDSTTITVSLTAKAGTAPTDGTGTRTLKIGGAWQGPNGANAFPFAFIEESCTNSSDDPVRVNFKNDAAYNITAAITHANTGPIGFRGYTTSYGDGGLANIDGGTSGASYTLFTLSQILNNLDCFEFSNNGATGSADAVNITSSANRCRIGRIVVHDVRGTGMVVAAAIAVNEVEAYACNQSNTSGKAGISLTATGNLSYCYSHDNTGSNSVGILLTSTGGIDNCVVDTNGSHGVSCSNLFRSITGLDSYGNTGSGLFINNATCNPVISNSNFCNNGGYGIAINAATWVTTFNCGFGSGTAANSSGTIQSHSGLVENASVTYAANTTPWNNPASGDFTITSSEAKNAGKGDFGGTQSFVGYPDIGAAQHQDSGGGSTIRGHIGGKFQRFA